MSDIMDEPPDGESARTHRLIQTTPYDGDITRDAHAYAVAGKRYDKLAAQLLRAGQTIVLTGYGCGIRVEHDALVVTEGRTYHPQQPIVHTLHRGLHRVQRIVCLNPKGSLSFPALEWCRDQKITVIILGYDGGLLSTLTPNETADAALRRRQYLAQNDGTDIRIAREILLAKFKAQRGTILDHDTVFLGAKQAYEMLTAAIAWFTLPNPPPWLSTLSELRLYEAKAALAYFAVWKDVPVRWHRKDMYRVPPHWRTCGPRNSPISSGKTARWAIDPVNACLNYAYGVLEGQCRQALSGQGFDATCGFLHADKSGRDSLVYDLMEMERGTVDGLVLGFLQTHVLHYGDLTKVSDGSCRLHPEMARAVVAACKLPQERIDKHAKWLRELLVTSGTGSNDDGER